MTSSKEITVYPREFSFIKGDDEGIWEWSWISPDSEDFTIVEQQQDSQSSLTLVEVPRILPIFELEVRGKIDTSKLTTNTKYEAVFTVMMEETAEGWECPVKLKFELTDMSFKSHGVILKKLRVKQWEKLVVGDFTTNATTPTGELNFSMVERRGIILKTGLIIKSVVVQPVHIITTVHPNIITNNNDFRGATVVIVNTGMQQQGPTGPEGTPRRTYPKEFVVYPRDLTCSTNSKDLNVWRWYWVEEDNRYYKEAKPDSPRAVNTVRLLEAMSFEIRGEYKISYLKPYGKYQVIIFLSVWPGELFGWVSAPVTLKLEITDEGIHKSYDISIKDMTYPKWHEVVIGDFIAAGNGLVKFSISEDKMMNVKRELYTQKVVIREVPQI